MRVYYDRFYFGAGWGILFALAWETVLFPRWILAVIALLILIGSYVGYVRTLRALKRIHGDRYNGSRG